MAMSLMRLLPSATGIPGGKSIIYYTQPGVEGEVFGMQTAYNALKNGGTCAWSERNCSM